MDFATFKETLVNWFTVNWLQIVVTAIVLFVYLLLDRFSTPRIEEGADQSRFKPDSAANAILIVRILFSITGLLVLAFIWGIDVGSIVVFAGTTLTLLGVALFAQWSLLSNITAYFILLLHPSFRRGNFVRVIDTDNYSEGYISDLTLFNTKLITENRETIVYPNNLLLGRPALINPRDRLEGVGKLPVKPLNQEE